MDLLAGSQPACTGAGASGDPFLFSLNKPSLQGFPVGFSGDFDRQDLHSDARFLSMRLFDIDCIETNFV